jgi:3-dehydroquinate synthase
VESKFVTLCNLLRKMGILYENSDIIFSDKLNDDLINCLNGYPSGKIFLATESNVNRLWLEKDDFFRRFPKIVVPAGEDHKKLSSVEAIWEFLSHSGADRKSLLINIGGGMLTDLAGFAASTFKRGFDFINIPTTLLSQVDASVGGKTGFNFNGLKNEIGTFQEPRAVFIHTPFLQTLDKSNFLSGYAEMIKHGLIYAPEHLQELMDFPIDPVDYVSLQEMIRHSVEVKKYFVANDPFEKNIRKALNFGHTVGHAMESMAMEQKRPVLHGYAVAWGMVAELFLSAENCGFPEGEVHRISQWIKQLFGIISLESRDFPELWKLMQHDKKNEGNLINFTLLSGIGKFEINQNCSKDQVMESLEFINLES